MLFWVFISMFTTLFLLFSLTEKIKHFRLIYDVIQTTFYLYLPKIFLYCFAYKFMGNSLRIWLQNTLLKPETKTPKPNSLTPKPEVMALISEAMASKPKAMASKPEAMASKPDTMAPKPEAMTPKPEAKAQKP